MNAAIQTVLRHGAVLIGFDGLSDGQISTMTDGTTTGDEWQIVANAALIIGGIAWSWLKGKRATA